MVSKFLAWTSCWLVHHDAMEFDISERSKVRTKPPLCQEMGGRRVGPHDRVKKPRLFSGAKSWARWQEGEPTPPPKSLEEGASDNISSNPPTSLPQCPGNASWKTDQCPHVCSPGTFLKGERIPVWGIFKVFVLDVFPRPSFQDEAEAGWVLELAENRRLDSMTPKGAC